MKLITRDTDYAIRALCFIVKQKKDIITVDDLVNKIMVPKPFIRKILQKLNKSGLLKSYKGKGGGFRQAFNPSRINIADLIRIFQGQLKLNEHLFKKGACPHVKDCNLRKKLDSIEKTVFYELKSITIESLIK